MTDAQAYRAALAHRLIDECGVDLIYGHSSHHVRGLERYNGNPSPPCPITLTTNQNNQTVILYTIAGNSSTYLLRDLQIALPVSLINKLPLPQQPFMRTPPQTQFSFGESNT